MKPRLPQDQAAFPEPSGSFTRHLEVIYPTCRQLAGSETWKRIVEEYENDTRPETLPDKFALRRSEFGLPEFLTELARLEWAIHETATSASSIPSHIDELILNPTLQVLQLGWKHLPALVKNSNVESRPPERGEEIALVWRSPTREGANVRTASEEDLLTIKMIVEEIPAEEIAERGQVPIAAVSGAIHRALSSGLLLGPTSRIHRKLAGSAFPDEAMAPFVAAQVFTLQWHITQACDLHCKHCYDRSDRSPLGLDQGIHVLDDLARFCKDRHVKGQVSFTGGNPLLHPRFCDLYQAAVDRELKVAVLGNPTSRKQLDRILRIQRPVFYQVSLEGLEPHNDDIRGAGHFKRVVDFLKLLRVVNIPSKVMLTLTEGNVDQVVPLAKKLGGLTDDFTFNRLSMVGEGANLRLPSPERFMSFLKTYVAASKDNSVMGWKDNFINIICQKEGLAPFGGCTGFGCGAAFNFVSLLSDGQVHACRKFPSPLGNIFEKGLAEIYDSPTARKYRAGPEACGNCPLWWVCRGCLAVSYSQGLDVFKDRDPYCPVVAP